MMKSVEEVKVELGHFLGFLAHEPQETYSNNSVQVLRLSHDVVPAGPPFIFESSFASIGACHSISPVLC